MYVDIDGERYEGCGATKQRAKYNAAKAALKKAFQICVILGFQISETKPYHGAARASAELKYSLLYETGMEHKKVFTMCVDIDGERYEGCRPTKQRAKCNAAKAALKKAFKIFVILGFQISETKTLSWRSTSIGRAQNTRCSTRPAKIIKKYLQCAWTLTVSGTRGVGRQNRGPIATPPRLH